MPNIIGYHANDSNRCLEFVNYRTIINSEDTYWLGRGMYFWDNLSNAKYWVSEKRRKAQEVTDWSIVQVNIDIEKLLDLTDDDVLNTLMKLWYQYCAKSHRSTKAPLGKKIDLLFGYFNFLSSNFCTIKGHGKYDREQNEFLVGTYVVSNIKTIYCVKNGTNLNIYNREFISEVV
jgi:hypothetical protein